MRRQKESGAGMHKDDRIEISFRFISLGRLIDLRQKPCDLISYTKRRGVTALPPALEAVRCSGNAATRAGSAGLVGL